MLKLIAMLTGFLIHSMLYAQPTFTRADMPDIGDNDTIWNLATFTNNHDLEQETGNGIFSTPESRNIKMP